MSVTDPSWDDSVNAAPPDPPAGPAWDAARIVDWVETVLFPVYIRPLKQQQFRWCETWWKHPEAWVRFEACRRAWEALAADRGIGFSVWHRDHLDPMLTSLLSDTGTFTNCTHSASSLTTSAKHTPAGEYPRQPAELLEGSRDLVDAVEGRDNATP